MACGICSRFLDFFSISFISLNNKFFEKIVLVIGNKRHLRFASSFHYRKSVATNIRHGSLFWETTSASTLDGKRRWRKLAMNKHCLERKCTSTIVNRPPCTDEGKKKKERTNKKRSSQFHRNLSLSFSPSLYITTFRVKLLIFSKISLPYIFKTLPLFLDRRIFESLIIAAVSLRKSISSRQYWRSARFVFSRCSYEVAQLIKMLDKIIPDKLSLSKVIAQKRLALGISIFRGKVSKVINKL